MKYYSKKNKIEGNIGIGKPYIGVKGKVIIAGQNILPEGEIKKVWEEVKFDKTFTYNIE